MPTPSSIRRLSPLPLLLIGLAALAVLVLIPWVVYAQDGDATPTNQSATGRPVILVSADGVGFLFAAASGIADGNGIRFLKPNGTAGEPDTGNGSPYYSFSYQWIRVDGGTGAETDIGDESPLYQLVDADIGHQIKVQVSFTDKDNYDESLTSEPFGPVLRPASSVLSPSTLVSNTGQSPSNTTTLTAGRYTMAFRLGTHGQGYEISSVSIDLAAVPSDLTVSLWIAGVPGLDDEDSRRYKLFDFTNPSSFGIGLNKFTAPTGAFVYQNVNHYIVLSGFGSSLSIKETTSDAEDAGEEAGAILSDDTSTDGDGALRMAVEGSRRDRGILAANYAQPHSRAQEIISVGDTWGWRLGVGAADRYLIRGFSLYADDTTTSGGGFSNPYDLKDGGTKLFRLDNSRHGAGINVWTAPRGATVAGGGTYDFVQDGPADNIRWDAVLSRVYAPNLSVNADPDAMPPVVAEPALEDTPTAPGVTLSLKPGQSIAFHGIYVSAPFMAVLGEPLYAMVQNLGQTDAGYVQLGGASAKVLSQGFTTGSNPGGYRLQGIGVNIDGSSNRFPDGPTSVSVAVHADSNGKPGAKLFDLVSPTEFGAGHSFFEAPPGTNLAPDTSYVMVWRYNDGAWHRLQRTSSDNADSGSFSGSGLASAYFKGADINNLTPDTGTQSLEIAVYAEDNALTVRQSWLHIPDDAEVGYRFRVVFVPFGYLARDATSADIEDYNALVQRQAAREYNHRVIRSAAPYFKAVVCTATVDARANTGMTEETGVPVHWLDGGWLDHATLIANTYDEFYSGEWVNHERGAYSTGNRATFLDDDQQFWTGCTADGVAHPTAPMGSTMGMVAVGTPTDSAANHAPLGAVDAGMGYVGIEIDEVRRLYAISPIFTVVAKTEGE